MYGNENGEKVFSIPVEWVVTENLEIRANSLKEAVKFIKDNLDAIPLGTEPDYVDGTYKISADEDGDMEPEEIAKEMKKLGYGYSERASIEQDEVSTL